MKEELRVFQTLFFQLLSHNYSRSAAQVPPFSGDKAFKITLTVRWIQKLP